jgi:hypothetical protein
VGELDSSERVAVYSLLPSAELRAADAQPLLRKATGRLDRRVVDRLVDELPGGIEHLQDMQFRHRSLPDDFRAPAAGVAALAWLRGAEAMLKSGMKAPALAILVAMLPARDDADHVPSG